MFMGFFGPLYNGIVWDACSRARLYKRSFDHGSHAVMSVSHPTGMSRGPLAWIRSETYPRSEGSPKAFQNIWGL